MENDTVENKENEERQSSQNQKEEKYTAFQVYELWWKFLSLSPKYKVFCEIMRSLTDKKTKYFYRQLYEEYKKRHPESEQLFDYDYYYDNTSNWEFMGDVHSNKFEEWWKNWKRPVKKSYSVLNLRDKDIKEKLPRYQFALFGHERREGKEPTPGEVIKYFTRSPEYIFVAIPLNRKVTINQISATINQMRKTAMGDYINPHLLNEHRYRRLYGIFKRAELEKYHDVYRSIYVDKLKRKDAKEKTKISDGSVFTKYLNNARTIITNVEKGIFPGKDYWGKSFSKKG